MFLRRLRPQFFKNSNRFYSSLSPKPPVNNHTGLGLIPIIAGAAALSTIFFWTMPPEDYQPFKPKEVMQKAKELHDQLPFLEKLPQSLESKENIPEKPKEDDEEKTETIPGKPKKEELAHTGDLVNEKLPEVVQEPEELKKDEVVEPPQKEMAPEIVSKFDLKAKYVLVGGGTASYACMKSIFDRDPSADVLILTSEDSVPYMRPPLSKELWYPGSNDLSFKDWSGTDRNLYYESAEHFQTQALHQPQPGKPRLIMNAEAEHLDVSSQILVLKDGRKIKYGKLLLANGGSPKQLPTISELSAEAQKKFSTFRHIHDFQKLKSILKEGNKKVVIVGGGFLGSELSFALSRFSADNQLNTKIVQIFPENGILQSIFTEYLVKWTTSHVEKIGVEVIPKAQISSFEVNNDKIVLELSDGSQLEADHVIQALGIEPNAKLAKEAGLEIDEIRGGVLVNAELEARRNIYAAGDLVSFHDPSLGVRRRIEHHDHAILSGRLAGFNMTIGEGKNPSNARPKAYSHQSMFWSDLGPEIGFEAVGLVDSQLETVGIWLKKDPSDTPKQALLNDEQNIRTGKLDAVASDSGLEHSEQKEQHKISAIATNKKENKLETAYEKGIVLYLREKQIVGVLAWNMFNKMPLARKLIGEKKKFENVYEMAQLFDLDLED